ncbi:MAG: hypothetical protein K2X77_14580 [Candidatus Obscuribacterales bacterium]|jgi:hypothetical protein|nr:hypothetical protein [Candidatus Obscuribacterales bacterium]
MSQEIIFPIAFGLFALGLTIASAWNWRGGKYLCDNCKFNNPEDCRKLDRPKAVLCKAYRKAGN